MRTSLVCAFAIVVVWSVVFAPMRAQIASLQTHLASAEFEIHRGQTSAATLPTLEREIRQLEAARESFHLVQAPVDAGSIVAALQSAAMDAHLRITALKPRNEPLQRGGMGHPVELGVEGTFHDVGRFLARLASSPRVMTLSDFTVRTRTGDRTGAGAVAGSMVIVALDYSAEASATDHLLAYDDGGRRDPFARVLPPQTSPAVMAAASRGRGLAAIRVADVVVRGVTVAGDRRLAILETPSHQSFVVRALDRLADSIVHEINPAGVTFVQRDQRGEPVEVHRPLRPSSAEHR